MAATSGTVYQFSPAEHGHLTPYLAALHASCVTVDKTIATFLPPLTQDKLLAYWKERLAEVNAGTRSIYLLLNESEPGTKAKGSELMGVVMLAMTPTETGSMRGHIEKLLVSSKFRRRGGATALMAALETDAAARGRRLLVSRAPTTAPS